MMRLYNFAFGPYPQRLTIYLAEKGLADVELIRLEPPSGKGNWPPAAIEHLSPSGSLPIIVDDDGTVVGQSLAILEYIEDTRSGLDMRGNTPRDRARTREVTTVVDEALTFFGVWARYGSRLSRGTDHESRATAEIGAERYFEKLRLTDRMIASAEFIAGDTVTTADCVAMAALHFILSFYGVPIPSDCSRLSDWYARFSRRPSAPTCDYPSEQHAFALGLMAQTGIRIPV